MLATPTRRTLRQSLVLSVVVPHLPHTPGPSPASHELRVQVEDYSGNKTDPVKIPTADELAKCTVADPTQPDAKKSTLTAVDGKAIRTVQATVKDSFGNPLANAEVAFELPEGVSAIGGNTTVKTDAAGVASLNVVSTKVGKVHGEGRAERQCHRQGRHRRIHQDRGDAEQARRPEQAGRYQAEQAQPERQQEQ